MQLSHSGGEFVFVLTVEMLTTLESVCSHLCHHQSHGGEGGCGKCSFSSNNCWRLFLRRWREAFWLRMKYFWGSNFSQDAFRPTLSLTAVCARSVHGYSEHLRQFCLWLVFHSNRVLRSAHQRKTRVSWNWASITAHLTTKDAYFFGLIDRTLYGDVNSTF